MSCKDEDELVCNTDFEDELLLSDDEPIEKTVATVNVGRPTSTATKPQCPSKPITIEDLWAEAIGMEIDPAVDKNISTTTSSVASPEQSLLKEASPAKTIFPQNQSNKAEDGQNEFPNYLKNNSKRDSDDFDNPNGGLNIKLKAERGDGHQTATKVQFKKKRYRCNRRFGDLTSREFLKPAQSQGHYQLKFEPIRSFVAQTNPIMNNSQPMVNQLNNFRNGYSGYRAPYNTWQQQNSNSSQSFVNRESNKFNLNISRKSPLIIQTSCTNTGNVGTRTVFKNPNFEGTKQSLTLSITNKDAFNPNDMINDQLLCGRSRIDDWSGKNPGLSSGDLRNRINNRTPASTVSSSETQQYLLQIQQQKLQREKFLHDKELRRQKANPEIFY